MLSASTAGDQISDGCAAVGRQKPNFNYQNGESVNRGKYLVNSLSILLRFLQISGKQVQKTISGTYFGLKLTLTSG